MQKLKRFLFLLLVTPILSYYGCDTCPNCPKDVRYSEEIKNAVQVGDVKNYISNQFDTLTFTCNSVEFVEGYGHLDVRQSECCPRYTVEYLTQIFQTDMEHRMIFDRRGGSLYIIGMYFPEIDFSCYNYSLNDEKIEFLELVGQEYENVRKVNCDSTGYSVYFGSGGIVGFTIDSMEWALIK